MSAHTPGPWRIATDKQGSPQHVVTDSYVTVCSFLTSVRRNCGTNELNANSRLIAAAPDLLQELRNIANADTAEWDDRTEFEAWAKSRARAAIAKATGVDQ